MWRAYRYIFFRVWQWQGRVWGLPGAEYSAAIVLSLLLFFNVASLTILFLPDPPRPVSATVVVYVSSMLAHYALLIRGGRLLKLAEEFRAPASPLLRASVFLYPAASVLVAFLLLWLRQRGAA